MSLHPNIVAKASYCLPTALGSSFRADFWSECMFSPHRYIAFRELGDTTPLQNQCIGVGGLLLALLGGVIFAQVLRGEAEGWFGAIVAGLFALTIVVAGTSAGARALAIAWARRWTDGRPAGPQVRRWLRSCVSERSVGLALPYAGMAAAHLWGLTRSAAQWGVPDALSEVMGIEFLCIHSMALLGLLALTSYTRWWARGLKYVGLVLLFAMYLGVALNNFSGWSVLGFAYLTLARFAAFRWGRTDESELIRIALRWAAQFMLFMFFGALLECTESQGRCLAWGAWYFGALCFLELFGAFLVPEAAKGTIRSVLGMGGGRSEPVE
jgi:hypothetical protein